VLARNGVATVSELFHRDDRSADRASSALCNRRKRSSERFRGDHHFLNVIAFRALKGAEVESDACGHDASEHHASTAPWAGGALDSNTDIVRQKVGFLHVLPLK
jgi:hypothetical protein